MQKQAQVIIDALGTGAPKMGDVKKLAAQIKKDHALAMELWSKAEYAPRLVAVLIMDKMQLTQEILEELAKDLEAHPSDERNKLTEWLLAHQLGKSKKTKALLESWQDHQSPVLRRLFWYHQARLRWTGQTPPDNTDQLMTVIVRDMAGEHPDVQWMMNFTAAQIGIHDPKYRAECLEIGERLGLYKGEPVSPGCTPSYLPEFISIEVAKLENRA